MHFKTFKRLAFSLVIGMSISGIATAQSARQMIGPVPTPLPRLQIKPLRNFKFEPRPFTVLVAYKNAAETISVKSIEKQVGLLEDTTCRSPYFKRYFLTQDAQVRGMTVEKAINQLRSNPGVRIAEMDMPVYPDQANDPQYGSQWGLNNTGQTGGTADADVDAPEAWPLIPVLTPVLVAILDDGIQINHADLSANIVTNPGEIAGDGIDNDGNGFIDDVTGWDFADNDNNPSPPTTDSSHGTHVAGIAAAVSNNSIGIASASRNVKLLPVRFYRNQSTWMSDMILGCDFARIRGAKVVSISYNLDGFTQLVVDAFNRLANADAVVMLSAGNNGELNPPRLAMLNQAPNLCFVASTNHNDNLSSFSNYGPQVKVAAPGEDILSTIPFGGYASMSGTSMATPFAAGVIGTVRALYPSLNYTQSINRLAITSDKKPQLTGKVTSGRVNLANAIQNDTVSPSPVSGVTLLRRSAGTFLVQFNASGDDNNTGGASFYEIRYSTSPINAGNFASAPQSLFPTSTPAAGNPVKTSIGGLIPGGSYYVGIKALDDVGNESSITTAGPFTLAPSVVYENMDGGTSPFTPTSSWARTSSVSNTGAQSWTDSPSGNYANNANTALTYSNSINVTTPMSASFMMRYDLESGYDFLRVEVSTNGGGIWTTLQSITGSSGTSFQPFSVPLTAYVGQTVQLRFRLTSDNTLVGDGVYIDDFSVQNLAVSFSDNVEGAASFTGTGSSWVVSTESSSSPTKAWNDSPGANYANNTNQLLKGTVDLDAEASGSQMIVFKSLVNTEAGYDFLSVNTSSDGGTSWVPRGSYSGTNSVFNSYSVPMGVLGSVRIGFRLTSDASNVASGAAVDDISVVGEPWVQQVNGSVGLNGFIGTKNFTVKLRSGATVAQTNNVAMTGLTGVFQYNTGLFGPYDVVIEGPSFLRKVVTGVNVTAFTNVATSMINGDINGDNAIGTADFNGLRAAWGALPSDPNWNANADLNGDGVVGTTDFNILRSNWGQIGDN